MQGTCVKIIEAQEAKICNNYKNTKLKLLTTNAAIWFNTICGTEQLTTKYFASKPTEIAEKTYVKHFNYKLYYQQVHLKYLCNLARY